MSTKTLRKRIAVVAVSALTAGLFSVVSAPVANAAELSNIATGQGLISGTLCATTDATGSATLVAIDGSTTDASPFEVGATAGRIVYIPVGGQLTVASQTGDHVQIKGSNLTIASLADGVTTSTRSLNVDGNVVVTSTASTTVDATILLNAATVGATTLVFGSAATTTATTANKVVVNVVATCGSGVWSESTSTWEWNTADQAVGDTLSTASVFSYDNADTAHLSIWGRTSLGSFLGTGVWQASVTGGCALDMDTSTATTAVGLLTTDALAAETGNGIFIQIAQSAANENKPVTCTVSVVYNSTTVHTRTISFAGQLASIVASKPYNALISDESFRVFTVGAFDSAGNRLVVTPTVDSTRLTTVVTNVTSAATSASGDITTGNSVVCGATAGSAVVRLKATATDGTTIYSNDWTVNCAAKPATYVASLDKASYLPGDIATLTITAKDSKGNLASGPGADAVGDTAADATISSLLGATTLHTIVGSQMEHVTAPAATDAFVNGVKTYQFKVGSTEGSYSMSVAIPDISTDTAKTVAYKVAGSGAVSNADVLKSIVALIASINKQIQALQKLILRR
jgi:hypothetical protein